jgi:hypothetical protein
MHFCACRWLGFASEPTDTVLIEFFAQSMRQIARRMRIEWPDNK